MSLVRHVWSSVGVLGLVLGAAVGCSVEAADGDGAAAAGGGTVTAGEGGGSARGCVENETQACLCPGGVEGVQVCTADESFTPCDCGTACAEGFEHSADGCVDIDECALGSATCAANATCINMAGGYQCACAEGFSGDGTDCVDDDECALGLDDCDANATCENTVGDFSCTCDDGYFGDGTSCSLVDDVVADISSKPATLQVDGIGTFLVHGLSRVGWDVDVIETPLGNGQTAKDMGQVSLPDITMRELQGDGGFMPLVDWHTDWQSASGSTRTVLLTIYGEGDQSVMLILHAVVPVAIDDTIVTVDGEARLTELTLEVGLGMAPANALQLQTITPAFNNNEPACPAPGHTAQIEGVTGIDALCVETGGMGIPAVGSSDPITLINVQTAGGRDQLYEWARGIAMGSYNRKGGDVFDYDLTGIYNGTARIQFFNAWPAQFNFFNPTKPFPSNLVDCVLVTEDVQQP